MMSAPLFSSRPEQSPLTTLLKITVTPAKAGVQSHWDYHLIGEKL